MRAVHGSVQAVRVPLLAVMSMRSLQNLSSDLIMTMSFLESYMFGYDHHFLNYA